MKTRRLLYSLLTAALTVAAFSAAGGYGIINLDDVIYLVDRADNYGFAWAFTWVGDAMWTPLTWLSYWADRAFFGTAWGWYHWHNVLLHAASAVLLFNILVAIASDKSPWSLALLCLATLVWSVHPLRTESVVWIASRKDCISTMFFLGALLAWVRSNRWTGLAISLVLLVAGGLAKASVMVFPVFALSIDFLVVGRRKPYWAYAVAMAIGLAFACEAGWAQKAGGAGYVATMIPQWFRILNAFCSLTIYAWNVLCPTDLAVQCLLRYPGIPRFSIAGLAILCACIWYCYLYARNCVEQKTVKRNPIVAGIAVFVLSIVPFLGFIGFGNHSLADRFTLLPCIGVSLAFVGVVEKVKDRARLPRRHMTAVAVMSCVAVAFCFFLSRRQTTFWQSDRALFEHTLEVDGQSNLLAQKVLVMHYYEKDHDFSKIFKHGYALLTGPYWQSKAAANLGPIILEAAYETGHEKEAEDIYAWQKHWGMENLRELRRKNPHVSTLDTLRYSDIVRDAFDPRCIKCAEKAFQEIEKEFPESFMMKNIRYLLARRSGDATRIKEAIRTAYAPVGESYLKNRWALKLAGESRITSRR